MLDQAAQGGTPAEDVRVHELARELGVESRRVLAALKELGSFAKSASSRVDAQLAGRVRERLAAATRPHGRPRASRTPQRRTPTVVGVQAFTDPQEAQIARALGVANAPARREGREPLTGYALALRAFPQVATDAEARRLGAAWASLMITMEQMREWIGAGLAPHQHREVRTLIENGIRPAHLSLVIDGARVGQRLRGGTSVPGIVGLLRAHRHLV